MQQVPNNDQPSRFTSRRRQYNPMYKIGENTMTDLEESTQLLGHLVRHAEELRSPDQFPLLHAQLERCYRVLQKALSEAEFSV